MADVTLAGQEPAGAGAGPAPTRAGCGRLPPPFFGQGPRLTYRPAQKIVRAEVNLDPNDAGVVMRVRGGT